MQRRPYRRPIWQPGRLSSLSAFLRNTLGKIRFKGLAIAVVALPLLLYVYREVTRDVLIIDPFTVPKQFEEAGLAPEVMANRIGDALRQMETATDSQMKKDILASLHDEGSPPDVEIPGTSLGLKTLVDITRSIFGINPKHISGDIVAWVETLTNTQPPIAKRQATITVYLAQGRNRNAAVSVEAAADDVELLVRRTAETVLWQVNPYVYASYLADHREYRRAIEIVRAMAENPSEDLLHKAAALGLWGHVLTKQRKYDEAVAKLELAAKLYPKLGFAYNNWGAALEGQGKYDEAIAKFRKAIALIDPKHAAFPYSNWGDALNYQRKYDEAIAKCRKAIELDPKDEYAYNNWGSALYGQKKYDEAIAKFRKAIELNPEYAGAYNNWGVALYDQNRYDDAIAQYRKAIEIDPGNSEAYSNWGLALNQQKRRDEAIAKFRTAIEMDPGYALAYNNWGVVLFGQKKYDDAIAKFQKAIELDPKIEAAYFNLGNMLFVQKRYDEAIARFQQAIGLDPKDALVYTSWGNALQAQGKHDEATAQFNRAAEPTKAPGSLKVLITGLQVGGEDRAISQLGESRIAGLRLAPSRNRIQVEFVAPGDELGEDLRYKFKLSGADTSWTEPQAQHAVDYRNLAAGSYQFLVKAVDPEGHESAHPAEVAFTILPPVWQRWWFELCLFCAAVALAYGLHAYRLKHIVAMERMRTAIATDLHDDIGSSLAQIAVLSEVAQVHATGSEPHNGRPMARIADLARELTDSINDIVWSIRSGDESLESLTRRMREFAVELLQPAGIALSWNAAAAPAGLRLTLNSRRQIFLIYKECMHNVVKHSGCRSASVAFEVSDREAVMTVADDGKGLNGTDGAARSTAPRAGNGLPNMLRRAQSLGGSMEFGRGPGGGCRIVVRLPVHRQAFRGPVL
jgi:tetratricopeptide (TPR) repeat protein